MIYVHVAKIQKILQFNNHGEEDFCNKKPPYTKGNSLCPGMVSFASADALHYSIPCFAP